MPNQRRTGDSRSTAVVSAPPRPLASAAVRVADGCGRGLPDAFGRRRPRGVLASRRRVRTAARPRARATALRERRARSAAAGRVRTVVLRDRRAFTVRRRGGNGRHLRKRAARGDRVARSEQARAGRRELGRRARTSGASGTSGAGGTAGADAGPTGGAAGSAGSAGRGGTSGSGGSRAGAAPPAPAAPAAPAALQNAAWPRIARRKATSARTGSASTVFATSSPSPATRRSRNRPPATASAACATAAATSSASTTTPIPGTTGKPAPGTSAITAFPAIRPSRSTRRAGSTPSAMAPVAAWAAPRAAIVPPTRRAPIGRATPAVRSLRQQPALDVDAVRARAVVFRWRGTSAGLL